MRTEKSIIHGSSNASRKLKELKKKLKSIVLQKILKLIMKSY